MYPRCEKLSALHPQCGSRLGGRYTCHTHYRSPSDLRLVWHALAIEHTRCEKLSSQLEVGRVAHRFCRVSSNKQPVQFVAGSKGLHRRRAHRGCEAACKTFFSCFDTVLKTAVVVFLQQKVPTASAASLVDAAYDAQARSQQHCCRRLLRLL